MNKISSDWTFLTKKVFPAFWFGFLGLFLVAGVLGVIFGKNEAEFGFLIFPVIMGGFGFFIFKNMIWDLMDEVYDEGDSLLIVNGKKEESIQLSDIKNVSYSVMMNPPRVTLSMRTQTQFGDEITFSPPTVFIPFKKNELIVELINRIDQARG
jgi:hypothetical protein